MSSRLDIPLNIIGTGCHDVRYQITEQLRGGDGCPLTRRRARIYFLPRPYLRSCVYLIPQVQSEPNTRGLNARPTRGALALRDQGRAFSPT